MGSRTCLSRADSPSVAAICARRPAVEEAATAPALQLVTVGLVDDDDHRRVAAALRDDLEPLVDRAIVFSAVLQHEQVSLVSEGSCEIRVPSGSHR